MHNPEVNVEVFGLLGNFNHQFTIPTDGPFVILHGPNGVGKTHTLEILERVAQKNIVALSLSPFSEFRITLDAVRSLVVTRTASDELGENSAYPEHQLTFELVLPNRAPLRHDFHVSMYGLIKGIVARDPALRFIESSGLVHDRRSDEILDQEDVLRRYGPGSPRFASQSQLAGRLTGQRGPDWTLPDEIVEFLDTISVYLIETQRLLYQRTRSDEGGTLETPKSSGRKTIDVFSKQLAEKLSQALAENSRISQKLDRSFPGRLLLLSDHEGNSFSEENVREEFERQAHLRKRLTAVSVGDSLDDVPLPKRELKDWERAVMALYLQDSKEKLSSFAPLLEKLELLKNIIDSKFLFKDLHFDAKKGFFFVTNSGAELTASVLSSGEQHELVLIYDLIFNVKYGDIVLIDEPEISLHVNWQKQFLDDLKRIADLVGVRFVIATHSPQIVGSYRSLMVALGPSVEG